jgi:hypothetical protein
LQELLSFPLIGPLGIVAHALALTGDDIFSHCFGLRRGIVLKQWERERGKRDISKREVKSRK